jgi:hypothetical protein
VVKWSTEIMLGILPGTDVQIQRIGKANSRVGGISVAAKRAAPRSAPDVGRDEQTGRSVAWEDVRGENA